MLAASNLYIKNYVEISTAIRGPGAITFRSENHVQFDCFSKEVRRGNHKDKLSWNTRNS